MAIFTITAPSGAGKTSIAETIATYGDWKECISHTTRKIRVKDGEVDGKNYYFTPIDKFLGMVDNGEFAEKVMYDKNHYGITQEEIERVMSDGKHVYIIVEYNGYEQIKAIYKDAIGIFIHMSKEDCMANMLLRGDSFEKATSRIEKYEDEMKHRGEFDYVVKNVRGKKNELVHLMRFIIQQNS